MNTAYADLLFKSPFSFVIWFALGAVALAIALWGHRFYHWICLHNEQRRLRSTAKKLLSGLRDWDFSFSSDWKPEFEELSLLLAKLLPSFSLGVNLSELKMRLLSKEALWLIQKIKEGKGCQYDLDRLEGIFFWYTSSPDSFLESRLRGAIFSEFQTKLRSFEVKEWDDAIKGLVVRVRAAELLQSLRELKGSVDSDLTRALQSSWAVGERYLVAQEKARGDFFSLQEHASDFEQLCITAGNGDTSFPNQLRALSKLLKLPSLLPEEEELPEATEPPALPPSIEAEEIPGDEGDEPLPEDDPPFIEIEKEVPSLVSSASNLPGQEMSGARPDEEGANEIA